jgi:hypothetical protein
VTDDQRQKSNQVTRETRLAQALRANLSKRKAASRGKTSAADVSRAKRTETEPTDHSE